MSRLGFIALLAVTVSALGASAAAHAGKISAPVHITIEARSTPQPGRLADVAVTVVSLADIPAVSIEVDLPDDLAVFSGDTHWQGPMHRSESRTLGFTLRVPEGGALIQARALARWGETTFGSTAELRFGTDPGTARHRMPRAHNGIREFPVD